MQARAKGERTKRVSKAEIQQLHEREQRFKEERVILRQEQLERRREQLRQQLISERKKKALAEKRRRRRSPSMWCGNNTLIAFDGSQLGSGQYF